MNSYNIQQGNIPDSDLFAVNKNISANGVKGLDSDKPEASTK